MASVQEPCMLRFYRRKPNGDMTLIIQDRVETLAPAGGAPDAAGASVSTPEKLLTVNSNVPLVNDDVLIITAETDGADTLDITAIIWRIPLVTASGPKTLGRVQFTNPALANLVMIAGVETVIAGYTIIEGSARLSGKIYCDMQDDT